MNAIQFIVFGKPEPKGSTRAFMRPGMKFPVVTSDNPKLKAWQNTVALGAVAARGVGHLPASCAVEVEIVFRLPRPLALAKKVTPQHITRPDTDKLARGILDALTKVIFDDDGQVVKLVATKAYAEVGETPRAIITVKPADLALFQHIRPRSQEAVS